MNAITTDTVRLGEGEALEIIDQTLLPNRLEILRLNEPEQVYEAIKKLRVRGAPAIGVAAAIGLYACLKRKEELPHDEFVAEAKRLAAYLNESRPTAVNLSWALNRQLGVLRENEEKTVEEILEALRAEAVRINEEDVEVCRAIGEAGKHLIKEGATVLTHCNAGQLATSRYGTATAPMYLAHEDGVRFKVVCDETRPLLQGARLTAFELSRAGLDVTLQCDNMAASLMKNEGVDAVFVGCDRVARNGDAANKIGTLGLAIIAKRYGVPFYVCCPSPTIDFAAKDGSEIVIEQRKPEEVTTMWYAEPMAPTDIHVYNPAFDVTDAELITAFITEKGVIEPPFEEGFRKAFGK